MKKGGVAISAPSTSASLGGNMAQFTFDWTKIFNRITKSLLIICFWAVWATQAQAASDAQPEKPIAGCKIGDARQLEFSDATADAILLLGPLYHLVERQDRHRSLSEAYRVLKTGGYLFAVGISRFASTVDGLTSGYFLDPVFQKIMHSDLENGQHRNPTHNPAYFTDTFFHHPDELKAEVANIGFEIADLLAVEGISYIMKDFNENWSVESHREFLLEIIGQTEKEQSLIGASPHIMCVAVKS